MHVSEHAKEKVIALIATATRVDVSVNKTTNR